MPLIFFENDDGYYVAPDLTEIDAAVIDTPFEDWLDPADIRPLASTEIKADEPIKKVRRTKRDDGDLFSAPSNPADGVDSRDPVDGR